MCLGYPDIFWELPGVSPMAQLKSLLFLPLFQSLGYHRFGRKDTAEPVYVSKDFAADSEFEEPQSIFSTRNTQSFWQCRDAHHIHRRESVLRCSDLVKYRDNVKLAMIFQAESGLNLFPSRLSLTAIGLWTRFNLGAKGCKSIAFKGFTPVYTNA